MRSGRPDVATKGPVPGTHSITLGVLRCQRWIFHIANAIHLNRHRLNNNLLSLSNALLEILLRLLLIHSFALAPQPTDRFSLRCRLNNHRFFFHNLSDLNAKQNRLTY